MFAGPIIAREVLTAPRPLRYYLWRASFSCFLFILVWTAWQWLMGWQDVHELGVMARFGRVLYYMFAMLQLTLVLFFAPLFTAAAISYEKDRRTFTLLLMTDLSDLEIVLGKLVAGLLSILTILAASIALVSLCALFGGISFGQVVNLFAVTAASGVAGGALGLLIALWRDRTFQSISLTILMVVFSVTGVEIFAFLFPELRFMDVPLAQVLNPYRAMLAVLYPDSTQLTAVVRATSVVYVGAQIDIRGRACCLWNLEAASMESRQERAPRASRRSGSRGNRDFGRNRGRAGRDVGHDWSSHRRGGFGGVRSAAALPSIEAAVWPSLHKSSGRFLTRWDYQVRSHQRPGCTSPDARTAASPQPPSRIVSRGPTRSSGAS